MSKILKFIWLVTLFAGLTALLWSYASVPLTVKVTEVNSVDREPFFYIGLAFLAITNFSLYGLGKINYFENYTHLLNWKYSLGMIINGFFIVSMLFVVMYNDVDPYNFDNFGYLILVFLGLMVTWLLVLPFLILLHKRFA